MRNRPDCSRVSDQIRPLALFVLYRNRATLRDSNSARNVVAKDLNLLALEICALEQECRPLEKNGLGEHFDYRPVPAKVQRFSRKVVLILYSLRQPRLQENVPQRKLAERVKFELTTRLASDNPVYRNQK